MSGVGGSRCEIIGNATLYLGDCRDVIPHVGDFAAIFGDPPYGMDYQSGHNSGRSGAGAAMVRKDGNFAPIKGDKVPFDPTHIIALDKPTILFGANYYSDKLASGKRWLIWDKLAGKTPVPSGSDIELAWTSTEGPSRMFTHLWRGIMRAGEENVVNGGKLHPNQKPVALITWCLSFLPAGAILDPYMGSASAGIACFRTQRPYIGIESDPLHFDVACRRIEAEHRQASLFANPLPDPAHSPAPVA